MVEDANPSDIQQIVARQRAFFATGALRDVGARREALASLTQAIERRQEAIARALAADLGKPRFEAYATEIGFVVSELREAASKVERWARPKRVLPGLFSLPGSAAIQPDPLGVVLIIGPWNYPFQLLMAPLVGALAAGDCAVLKPSELTPHTSAVIAELIAQTFNPGHVTCVQGGVETGKLLLEERWDHVFFTGSTGVGRLVMQAAARHLTPTTLELGGKSPTIVEADADLHIAARRIAWGKLVNAGQTCIAPDFLWVQESVKPAFVEMLREAITRSVGADPRQSPAYARIVSPRHAERLGRLLEGSAVLFGGEVIPEERYVAPTLVEGVGWDHPLMQEEIFGPILPILTYRSLDQILPQINARPKPLALYLFTRDEATVERVLRETTSGGACINDVAMHFSVPSLPFGGVGESGTGAYHSERSFITFSHMKSVLRRGTWADPSLRYPPWTERSVALVKRAFGMR